MKTKIMIVEDEGIIALSIRKKLEMIGYEVPIMVTNGEDALTQVVEESIDLALMDIMLGEGMNGIETAVHLREQFDIPIIYLTANVDEQTIQRAKVTEPYGYLVKPFEERELATTIEMALYKHKTEKELNVYRNQLESVVATRTADLVKSNEKLQAEIGRRIEAQAQLKQAHEQLEKAYDETLTGWAHALELRDTETAGHSQRVTEMTLRLARAMGLPEADMVHIRRGCLLHDIGKMGIPDGILLKPGRLTAEERQIMEQHPKFAYDMLRSISYLQPALDIPYCHHERWDGQGYPQGLKGEEIPLTARLFAIVDVWDAVLSERPYHHAWPREKALQLIQDEAGHHFDPQAAAVFLQLVAEE